MYLFIYIIIIIVIVVVSVGIGVDIIVIVIVIDGKLKLTWALFSNFSRNILRIKMLLLQ